MKNWKQQIYKQRKLIVYSVITMALLFANYKFFFRPNIASLIKTVPQVRQLQGRVNSTRIAIANIPRYKAQIEELRKRLSSHKKRFSTEQQISSLLKELSEMAKSAGVKITAIEPHRAVSAGQQGLSTSAYQRFPISINAGCGYHQLGTFLNKLENADIFMRVKDIKISADAQNSMEQQVYILVNTYVLTEGA